jgi:hypothetical protein
MATKYPLAQPLWELCKPPEPPKPLKGPGRPKALTHQSLDEFQKTNSKSRHFGQLLKAIAEISFKNPACTTYSGIAGKLVTRPQYKHISESRLRRNVSDAIQWEIALLKKTPSKFWVESLGIAPPPVMTNRALRDKALEFLRHYLNQQLLAKKP